MGTVEVRAGRPAPAAALSDRKPVVVGLCEIPWVGPPIRHIANKKEKNATEDGERTSWYWILKRKWIGFLNMRLIEHALNFSLEPACHQ
ncbi:Denn Domain-Containing Protein 1A [Manis pentadactyla]|nr:Denn Domain-Containing Protein 1A [Manis pentadactyla]